MTDINKEAIRKDISFIKKHMFDSDSIMTSAEAKRFEKSVDELKKGETISLDKLKREIGV